MDSANNIIKKWINEYDNFELNKYEELSEVDLYMDQVIFFLSKKLGIFNYTSEDKPITPSMINNYVKGKVISAPIKKKYNREHLAYLFEVYFLKQVLSLEEVSQILKSSYNKGLSNSDVFNNFAKKSEETNDKLCKETLEKLENIEPNDFNSLNELALNLALEANSAITLAKRILYVTNILEHIEKEKIEDEE